MFTLISDKYRQARGGYARFLLISCAKCGAKVLLYQKDGPGVLKRLYLDRIHAPVGLRQHHHLVCPKCDDVLGTRIVYEKEGRPAFRLYQNSVTKKVTASGRSF